MPAARKITSGDKCEVRLLPAERMPRAASAPDRRPSSSAVQSLIGAVMPSNLLSFFLEDTKPRSRGLIRIAPASIERAALCAYIEVHVKPCCQSDVIGNQCCQSRGPSFLQPKHRATTISSDRAQNLANYNKRLVQVETAAADERTFPKTCCSR